MTRMLLTQKFSLRERCTSWSFCGSINFVHLNGTVVFTSPLHHSVLILIFLQGNLRGFLVFRAGCKLLKYICVSFSGWADLSKRYTMDHLQCFICHCWMRLLLKNQQYKRIHDPWIPGIGADRWVYCTSHKYVRWGPPPPAPTPGFVNYYILNGPLLRFLNFANIAHWWQVHILRVSLYCPKPSYMFLCPLMSMAKQSYSPQNNL